VKTVETNILIIGGGVIGLSIARELHKRGITDITILERGRAGEEASWAAAGMLSPQIEAEMPDQFFEFCCRSRDMYPDFADELRYETDIDIDLERTGSIYLVFADEGAERILDRLRWQREAGFDVETMSDEEIAKSEPHLRAGIAFGVAFKNDWQVDNRKLLIALKRYAELNGIRIIEDSRVEWIDSGGKVHTTAGAFGAGNIVVATGAWTSLIKMGSQPFPIHVEPIRGQIVCLEAPPGTLSHVIYTGNGYLVPRLDGRILAGSTSEPAGFDKSTTGEAVAQLSNFANAMLPATPLKMLDAWAGLRPRSADEFPVIGPLDGVAGLIVATGHYRNGILLAPATAEMVADNLIESTAYPKAFSPSRFLKDAQTYV
jgi:glycine oxidase